MKKNTFLTKIKSFSKEKLYDRDYYKNLNHLILLVLINFFAITSQAQTVRYVKAGGTGNGSSWAAASGDIQAMINASSSGDEVKVAAGTYKPNRTAESPGTIYTGTDNTTKRKRTFLLKAGVKVIGGFPADASTTNEVSKPIDNKTILSGDFDDNDTFASGVVLGGNSENAYNVVMISGNANEVYTLKGFHITGGNANSTSSITINSSDAITLNTGGGINIVAKSVTNTNSNTNDYTKINIEACVIYRNTAKYGGGIRLRSKTEANILNSIFYENYATDYGGAISNSSYYGRFNYNTFYSNRATLNGGAIQSALHDNDLVTSVKTNYANSIFDQNIKGTSTTNILGSDISVGNGTESNNRHSTNNNFVKTRIQYQATYADFSGSAGGSTLGNALFTTTSVPFANANLKDFRLHYSADFEGDVFGNDTNDTFDINGKPRRIGYSSDIGAHEWQLTPDQNGVLYVKKGATGFGSSWNDAVGELATGIYFMNLSNKGRLSSSNPNPILHGINEIWISEGTYKPQFGNVIGQTYYDPDEDEELIGYSHGYDPTSPRAEFYLEPNTKIFGGFPNTGNPVKADRNWKNNPTIISGDINDNDTATGFGANLVLGNRADNSLNLFVLSGDAGTSVLDGLQFQGGNASIDEPMMLLNNSTRYTTYFNRGVGGAGKISIDAGSVDIINCVFKQNFAIGSADDQQGGGALFIDTYTDNSVNIINTLFESNKSNQNGGALDLSRLRSNLKIINSTFSGNLSNKQGGAIAFGTWTETLYLQNSIVFGNAATTANTESFTTLVPASDKFFNQNNLIEGFSSTSNGNLNATGVTLANLFKSSDRTNTDYLQLTNNAVAKNAGNNSLYLATFPTFDLAKNTRVLGNTIDLGAYENTCNLNLPTAQAQTFCTAATVANLVATGSNIKWYATTTATQPLANNTALSTGTYYVTQTTGTCESSRLAVNITVNQVALPTAQAQTFCTAATVANLVATGSNIKWYSTTTATQPLANNTALATGTYYATQTTGTCESGRLAVNITVNQVALPTAQAQTFCTAATVANLVATGSNIKWYATTTATQPLANNTALSTGTYYATQTTGTCESGRLAVNITVNQIALPTAQAQTFCTAATVANLVATGSNIKWYATTTATQPLANNTALSTGTYYVTQTTGTCESSRLAVNITVNQIALPTAQAQTFCTAATVANLVATGSNIKWYATTTATQPLANNTALATGTYYATQTTGTCESGRLAVNITVNQVALPTAQAQTFCTAATVANLVATGSNIKWYATTTATQPLANNTALATGTYYATQTTGTCESGRLAVNITVNQVALPTAQAQTFCTAATVANLVATGSNIKWYATTTATQPLANNTALATGTYYATQTIGTCESGRLAVNITILPQAALPTANASQELTEGSILSDITISPSNVIWYASSNNAINQTNALNGNTPLVNGATYYAVNAPGNNQCPSNPLAVTIVLTPALGNEDFDKNAFSYYPNPIINSLNIKYKNPINKVEVFDLQGRKIKSQHFDSETIQINLSELPTAIYLLKVYSINQMEVIRVIKK